MKIFLIELLKILFLLLGLESHRFWFAGFYENFRKRHSKRTSRIATKRFGGFGPFAKSRFKQIFGRSARPTHVKDERQIHILQRKF